MAPVTTVVTKTTGYKEREMSKTEIQAKVDGLRSRISGATDLDQLKEYSLKVVDLLVKVDQLVDLGDERRVLVERKLDSVTAVANGLIEMLETIRESSTILDKAPAYSAAIVTARKVIDL